MFEKEVGLDKGQDYEKLSKININWLDKVYNDKAPLQNYELSVNGGTEKLNYYVSGSYYDQDGIAVGSTFERVNFRANVEAKANKWLKIGTNTMFTYQEVEQSDDGEYALWAPISASFFMLPYWKENAVIFTGILIRRMEVWLFRMTAVGKERRRIR